MLKDIKEVVVSYSIVGSIIALFTLMIRPFISWKQTIRDSAIVFCFTVLGGLILENWKDLLGEEVRTGLAGVFGFFAVRFYEIIIVIMEKTKENPSGILDIFKWLRGK